MHQVNSRQQVCRDGQIKKQNRVRESARHTFGSIATQRATQKKVWDELHGDARAPHCEGAQPYPQYSGSEPCRGTDLTGCSANTEGEGLAMRYGNVMRTTSEDRWRHCEKIRRLEELLMLP